jgi:hypothetical protein
MLVAHEAPLCIMDKVQEVTDYDYCLVHLLEESPEYLKFFKDAKQKGRKIMMDCSLFELGKAFDAQKYYDWLLEIQPDEYIVPDVWQDCEANTKAFSNFKYSFDLDKLKGKKIGVVQGKTLEDMEECYVFMSSFADKIAISFGYDLYWELFSNTYKKLLHLPWILEEFCAAAEVHPLNFNAVEAVTLNFIKKYAKPAAQAEGRMAFINHLMKNNLINTEKPHHLLGCGVPIEFGDYDKLKYFFIESIDTSHPVMTGYYGASYSDYKYMWSKLHSKMVDVFYENVSEDQWEKIKFNIEEFKKLAV